MTRSPDSKFALGLPTETLSGILLEAVQDRISATDQQAHDSSGQDILDIAHELQRRGLQPFGC